MQSSRLDTAVWFLHWISGALLLLQVTYLAIVYSSLPQFVPVHFDFSGTPDVFGHRYRLWAMPAISAFLWVVMTVAGLKRPNQAAVPGIPFRESLAILKTLVMALLLYITWAAIRTAQHRAFGVGKWLVPTILFLVLGSSIALLLPARNRRRRHMAK